MIGQDSFYFIAFHEPFCGIGKIFQRIALQQSGQPGNVAHGQGHNVIGRGCIPKVVVEFVDQLEPKQLDVKCVDALGPTPAFVDFNGAAP